MCCEGHPKRARKKNENYGLKISKSIIGLILYIIIIMDLILGDSMMSHLKVLKVAGLTIASLAGMYLLRKSLAICSVPTHKMKMKKKIIRNSFPSKVKNQLEFLTKEIPALLTHSYK